MNSFSRLKASLLLTPAIILLLAWVAVYGGSSDEVSRMGIPVFLVWVTAISLAISYCITLYVARLRRE